MFINKRRKKKNFLIQKYLLTILVSLFFTIQNLAFAETKLENNDIKEGRLAYTYSEGSLKDIYVIDFANKTIKSLVSSPAVDEYPSWSPDGRKLAFHSDMSGDREIYLIDADGSNLKQITKSKGKDENPDWSPDGQKLVYQSSGNDPSSTNLFIMDIDSKNVTPLTESKSKNTVPHWSPRGDEILYSTNNFWPGWDIMLYNINTKEIKQLTTGLRSFCRASWDPTASSFVFSFGSGNEIDLWIEDKGSSKARRLTTRSGREYDALWKDENNIFFVAESAPGNNDYQIFIINIESKIVTQITSGSGTIRYLSWTPLPTPPPTPVVEEVSVTSDKNATKDKRIKEKKK